MGFTSQAAKRFTLVARRIWVATPPTHASASAFVVVAAQGLILFVAFGAIGPEVFVFVVWVTTMATSFRRVQKQSTDPSARTARTWKNALANAGVAWALAIVTLLYPRTHFRSAAVIGFIASLAAALSDTVSHEFGVVLGPSPRSIISFRRVLPGANGGVSAWGSLCGLAASFAVAALAFGLSGLSLTGMLIVTVAGFLGNIVDSILGATLEEKGWIQNDLVNLGCSLSGAGFGIAAWSLFLKG